MVSYAAQKLQRSSGEATHNALVGVLSRNGVLALLRERKWPAACLESCP
jgi:hypothetical protein